MRRKLTVLAIRQRTLDPIVAYLNEIFSEYLEIKGVLISDYDVSKDEGEWTILSGKKAYAMVKDCLLNRSYYICEREIDYRTLNHLTRLRNHTNVYVVNDNPENTSAVCLALEKLEINNLNYIPYYPGCEEVEDTYVAVTAGEHQLIPDSVRTSIDIGTRLPSISAVIKICNYFDISPNKLSYIGRQFLKNWIKLIKDNQQYFESLYDSEQVLNNIYNNSREGLCLLDSMNVITTVSDTFSEMMSWDKSIAIGSDINNILLPYDINMCLEDLLYEPTVIKNYEQREILLNAREMMLSTGKITIISASYASDISDMEILIRQNEVSRRCHKKYDFASYLTQDSKTLTMIEKAKKVALLDSTILIQGESGTGKEILAQSIHQASSRRNEPFIPVNFAAIQENLLESELFGYVEGAFTGAMKGGSKGLFEMAHNGTIFFDEIGDAPLNFQVRLLRVLQEQEIRRIGETKRIPINVRVIAATNKDLFSMIKTGQFREDLFYRLCVIPLNTVPLRQRRGDILFSMNHVLKSIANDPQLSIEDICTQEVIDYFSDYEWRGNVREIMNIVTYLLAIRGAHLIDIHDLPKYMFLHQEDVVLSSVELQLLRNIRDYPKSGRKKIKEMMLSLGYTMSEGEIRTYLNRLNQQKLIKVNKTRGGCEITHLGQNYID